MIDWDAFWNCMDYEIEQLNLSHRKVTRKELATFIGATGACLGMAQTDRYGVKDKGMDHVFNSEVTGLSTKELIDKIVE
jgi:hypothetical protein